MCRTFVFGLAATVFLSPVVSAQSRSPVGPDTRWTLSAVGDVIMNRRLEQFDHRGTRLSMRWRTLFGQPTQHS